MSVNVEGNKLIYRKTGRSSADILVITIFVVGTLYTIKWLLEGKSYEGAFWLIIVLSAIGAFMFFLLRYAQIRHFELWFEDDKLCCFKPPRYRASMKLSDMGHILFGKAKAGFEIIIPPKDSKSFELVAIRAPIVITEVATIIKFLKSGLESRGYEARDTNQESVWFKGIELEFRKKSEKPVKIPRSFEDAAKIFSELTLTGLSRKDAKDRMWENGFTRDEIDYALKREIPEEFVDKWPEKKRSPWFNLGRILLILLSLAGLLGVYYMTAT